MAIFSKVSDPYRLASLRQTMLLDTPPEQEFDRITQLAAKLLGTPVALMSLVDIDRQFFKSCVGLPEPWATERQTPLTHSFCQHVVTSGSMFKVDNARTHPQVCDKQAIEDLNVAAYLGAPLTGPGGQKIGALCVIDTVPRSWSAEQERLLEDLAGFVVAEIGSRRASAIERSAEIALKEALEEVRLRDVERQFTARFRFLADAMPQMVWTAKPDGNLDYYNQRWFDYTGSTFEQMKDQGWKPTMHPDDLGPAIALWMRSLATGEPFEGEFRFKRASDGAYRWHLGRALAMRDSAGKIVQWVGTTTDIHEQKLHSAALRDAHDSLERRVSERTAELVRQQQFLETVLDNNLDGIVACDATGKLTVFNRALREIIGGDTEQPPEKWAEKYQVLLADGITPMPQALRPLYRALNGEIVRDEEILVLINGGPGKRRMLVNGQRISDVDGRSLGAVIAVHDITERAAAEKRFHVMFEQSSDAHLLFNDGGILDCNAAAVKLFGTENKANLSSTHPAVFAPEFQPDGRRSSEKRVEMDGIAVRLGKHRFEWTVRSLQGVDVPVEVTLTAVEIDGKTALLSVIHDLTERKNAEGRLRQTYASLTEAHLALRQSEERFHTFMDYSPAAAFIKDEHGRFIYVNRRFADIFGSTPDEMRGKKNSEYQSEVNAGRVRESDQTVLRTNLPLEVDGLPPFPTGENGRWTVLKFPLKAPNGGRCVGGIAFDVSAARRAEMEIARQKQFFEAVIENASDGIVACDQEGRITCMNRAIRQIQGVDDLPAEVTREWFVNQLALYDPNTGNLLEWEQRPLARALNNDPVSGVELIVKPVDGRQRVVVVSSCPIAGPQGQTIGAVAAWHDVTDLRRSQEELLAAKNAADAANHAKSEFLANMSHEIRTPMTAILGYTDLLDNPAQSSRQRAEHIHVIRRNGQHLMQLLSDILDLSKIEAGEMTVEKVSVDPGQLLDEVHQLMRPRALAKGIDLSTERTGDLPATVFTDPTRLRQILLNLVGNAIKFTERGEVKIRFSRDSSAEHPRLRFDVSDTGIGIAADQQLNLFRPFRQADGSTTRRFGGTGLGLAICRQLALLLGGELTLFSQPGAGTTFTLLLPGTLNQDSPNDATTVSESKSFPAKQLPESIRLTGRILVAEDGIDNQRLVRLYLEAAGLAVQTAANGRFAVESVVQASQKGTPFDAVLMDMQMPELDGYGATTELRKAGFTRLPIIAFTAHAQSTDRERCTRSGCDDYVTKPIDRLNLLNVLSKYLRAEPSTGHLRSDKETDPLISMILSDYITGLPEQVGKLSHHLSRADLRNLRLIIHQIKGSGGSYGFPEITNRARSAEAAITGKEPMDRIVNEVQSLVELVRRVQGYDRTRESLIQA
jgi:PAS domain S-box-containing protein